MLQGGASVVKYRLAGREYPLRTISTCLCCQSKYRHEIESEIAQGRVYSMIAKSLPEDAHLSTRNIANHFDNGHMPLQVEVQRRLLNDEALAVGRSISDGVESIVSHVSLARITIQKTYEAIASGEIRPTLSDGLVAARLLAAMGFDQDTGVDTQAYVQAFMIYHETAQRTMGLAQFEAFGAALAANPVLKALVDKHTADRTIEPDQLSEGSLTTDDDVG